VFRASGDVVIEGERGVVGPISEVYVTAKLDKIATSESYFRK
jgi:hypothetical protein